MNVGRLPLPPNQGGYPDNRWSDSLYLNKDIDLGIMYGLHHHFGEYFYNIVNRAARSYINVDSKQEIDLFRKTLNEHGLLTKLIEINDLYKDGKL